jgi:D-glycero-alpha-D-manno-heptose-7-phosphate kinase
MITARAPMRISFGGGGTDLPAYYERFGGLVLSAAIDAACHVVITPHANDGILFTSDDFACTVALPARRAIRIEEPLPLQRAVLAWFQSRGLLPWGVRIAVAADVAPGTGLGSSSAMTVALITALARYVAFPLSRQRAAEIACDIEIELLGRPIGKQDQYASAHGGLNVIEFSSQRVRVTPLCLAPTVETSLREHLLLVSTRQSRDSASVLAGQRAATRADGDVTTRLHQLKALASAMRDALIAGDLPAFGALLDEGWQLKRGLARGVSSSAIDRWYECARAAGAYGGKICGAGGGGFFLFCVAPAFRDAVARALRQEGLMPRAMTFDHRGATATHLHAAMRDRFLTTSRGIPA